MATVTLQLYADICVASDRLDALMREVSEPITSQRRFEELEEEAQAIAKSITVTFRERRAPRAS